MNGHIPSAGRSLIQDKSDVTSVTRKSSVACAPTLLTYVYTSYILIYIKVSKLIFEYISTSAETRIQLKNVYM
jgi:hypothetical protein